MRRNVLYLYPDPLSKPEFHPCRTLYKLLRCTCLHCFKFKMSEEEVSLLPLNLILINLRLPSCDCVTSGRYPQDPF